MWRRLEEMTHDLLHAITARADELYEHLPGTMAGRSRAWHRARVAARRLTEVLVFAGDEGRRASKRVRQIRRACGDVRERDVALALLEGAASAHHWPRRLVARVRAHLQARVLEAAAAAADACAAIDQRMLRARIRAAGHAAAGIPAGVVRAAVSERVRRRESALVDAARRAGRAYDTARVHEVRIAVKRLRYVLEVAADVCGRRTARRIRNLKSLQTALGRLHDLQVLEQLIRDAAGERGLRGARRMADAVQRDCRRRHADLLVALRREAVRR